MGFSSRDQIESGNHAGDPALKTRVPPSPRLVWQGESAVALQAMAGQVRRRLCRRKQKKNLTESVKVLNVKPRHHEVPETLKLQPEIFQGAVCCFQRENDCRQIQEKNS